MFNFEQLPFIIGTIVSAIILGYLFRFVQRLERKYDLNCFIIGDAIFMGFCLLLPFSPVDQVPSLITSLVIAELTLALVWVELSKRPELRLGDFIPVIYGTDKGTRYLEYKAGFLDEEPEPTRFLRIKEVSHKDLKFDEHFSFSVDLSNIGYQEIMVHDYKLEIDGKRQKPIPLGKPPYDKRLRLITQDRHTVNIPPLNIESSDSIRYVLHFQG